VLLGAATVVRLERTLGHQFSSIAAQGRASRGGRWAAVGSRGALACPLQAVHARLRTGIRSQQQLLNPRHPASSRQRPRAPRAGLWRDSHGGPPCADPGTSPYPAWGSLWKTRWTKPFLPSPVTPVTPRFHSPEPPHG
jgi:hypothetical protein